MVKTAAVVLAGMLCGMLFQDVDNPEYKHWSKFKKGAFSKTKTETDTGQMKMESEMTVTLTELGAEKAVLETKMVSIMMGTKTEMPAQKRDVPAKVKKGDDTGKKPEMKEGDEEVEAAGKKFKCHWVEMTTEQSGMKTTSKSWTSNDVPGMMVKSESKTEGAMKSTSKTTLVEFSVGG